MQQVKIIISIVLAAIFLAAVGIASIDLPPSGVIIYAFNQNPAGLDKGNEWVAIHNPTNKSVNIGKWTLETTNGSTATVWIAEGTSLYPGAYNTISPSYRWIDNNNESIILRDAVGNVVDRTPVLSDNENDNRYWMRNNSEWTFGVTELKKGELWIGYVKNVVDGDTIDVHFNIYGIQRVRLVGINTPEIGEDGYEEAKAFLNETCMWEEVTLDVDDEKQFDPYYRILAVVYVNETNLNEKLVKEGYAEVMYVPPSEFDSRDWEADYTPSSSPTPWQTPYPCPASESFPILVFAIIAALIVSVVLPGKGQQKFWAKFLGQNIAYAGAGRVATFIIVFIVIILGYILLRITPG
jgi:micrococcal nuclease